MSVMTDVANVVLSKFPCNSCGITFAVPEIWLRARQADGKTIYCPNGHSLSYGKTRTQELQEQLSVAQRQIEQERRSRDFWIDQADLAERKRAAAKGEVTKLKKRVANGVCPECNRSFADLHRHMDIKHGEGKTKPEPSKKRRACRFDDADYTARVWGRENGWPVGDRGRMPAGLLEAFLAARAKARES